MRFESTASRVRSSGACHSISSSKVRLASSIIAHSSPSTPASTRRSSLPSSRSPSALASRRAGSIVSTATFFPRAAMPSAIAAEAVVLPTPPEPAQMQTCLRSSQSSITASPPAGRRAAPARVGAALARTGTAASSPARAPPRAGARAARAAPPPAGAPPAPPPTAAWAAFVPARSSSRRRRASPASKRSGSTPFATTWPISIPRSVAEPLLEVDRLVHGHLLGQRHADHAGRVRIAQEAVDLRRLARDRADPRDVGVGARRRAAAPARGRWRGRP